MPRDHPSSRRSDKDCTTWATSRDRTLSSSVATPMRSSVASTSTGHGRGRRGIPGASGSRAPNALATRSIDEVWAGVRRSSRIQIPLELPVEVLVRPDVEDFDDVSLRVELVGKQKLERLDFELDVPHTLERSDLGLADERVGDDAP